MSRPATVTRYEVVLVEASDPEPRVMGYVARRNRLGLQALIGEHAEAVLELLDDDNAEVRIEGAGLRTRIVLGGNLEVRFSGRTERTALTEALA